MVKYFFKRILPLIVTVFALVFPLFNVRAANDKLLDEQILGSYKGILTLWHIENFEGGKNSRETFLFKRTLEFSKANEGVFIQVINMTEEQMLINLSSGPMFDLISFSSGIGDIIKSYLKSYDGTINVTDNFLDGIYLEGKLMGLPYSAGGYVLMAYEDTLNKSGIKFEDMTNFIFSENSKAKTEPLSVGFSKYNNPLKAIQTLTDKKGNLQSNIFETVQSEAYTEFVSKRAIFLLGTQRDIFKKLNRESAGDIENIQTVFVKNYTDLVQYIAINKHSDIFKQTMARKFMEYLTSDGAQTKLSDIGLFPVNFKNIYTGQKYLENFELAVKNCETISVFTSKEELQNLRQNSKTALSN